MKRNPIKHPQYVENQLSFADHLRRLATEIDCGFKFVHELKVLSDRTSMYELHFKIEVLLPKEVQS